MPDRFDAVLNYLSSRLFTRNGRRRVDLNARPRSATVDQIVEMSTLTVKTYPQMTREEIQQTLDDLVAFRTVECIDGAYRMRSLTPDQIEPKPRHEHSRSSWAPTEFHCHAIMAGSL